jgi:hypothetical protein
VTSKSVKIVGHTWDEAPIAGGSHVALAPAETIHLSRLVGAIGALGDTDDHGQALAHWRLIREHLANLVGAR